MLFSNFIILIFIHETNPLTQNVEYCLHLHTIMKMINKLEKRGTVQESMLEKKGLIIKLIYFEYSIIVMTKFKIKLIIYEK